MQRSVVRRRITLSPQRWLTGWKPVSAAQRPALPLSPPLSTCRGTIFVVVTGPWAVDIKPPGSSGFSYEELSRSHSPPLRKAFHPIPSGIALPGAREASTRPAKPGEVFRRSEPAFTQISSWNKRNGASRTVQIALRFAGTRTTRGALRDRLCVPKNNVPKNITSCMTISARIAARVPVRDIAGIAAGATPPPTAAPRPGPSPP
jgi:hypothetical protein